jgi:hypothetical protein
MACTLLSSCRGTIDEFIPKQRSRFIPDPLVFSALFPLTKPHDPRKKAPFFLTEHYPTVTYSFIKYKQTLFLLSEFFAAS